MALLLLLWALYLAYIGYTVHDWMDMRKIAANLDITDRFFLMKIGISVGLLLVSVVLKLLSHAFAAKFILALPIGMIVVFLTFKALSILFVWIVMFLGAK